MKTFVRLIRRYVLAAVGVVLLLLFSGVAVLGWLGWQESCRLPQQLLRRPAGAYPGSRYDLLQSLLHGVSSRRWSAVSCPAGWAKPQSYRAA